MRIVAVVSLRKEETVVVKSATMAGFSRRPATRERVSSTQEEATEDDVNFSPLNLDGEDTQQQERIQLTQVDDFGVVNVTFGNSEHTPQHDNPSQHLPGDENDRDTALEEFLSSESKNPVENGEQEFSLEIETTDDEEDEEDDNNTVDNNTNVPSYTQRTLEAASVLMSGFNDNEDATAEASSASLGTSCGTFAGHCNLTAGQKKRRTCRLGSNEDDDDVEEESENQIEEPVIEKEATTKPPTPLAASIAAQLRADGLTGTGLTIEEQNFIDNVDEGKNKKAYDESQVRHEKRFFETLATCGGKVLAPLATEMLANPHDQEERDRLDRSFYAIVGGEKNADKHQTLNKCFTICGCKWNCLTGSNKGKRIQPNSFCKMMQCLSYLFNRKGVQCTFNDDFNSKGDFHGVMKVTWREERKKDPSHGTGSNQARVDSSLVRKFIQAIRDGTMCPYTDPEHCLICVIFILGCYCGLRGSSEHVDLASEMVHIGEYTVEDGPDLAGLRWGGVKVPFSKTNQLNMKNTRLPVDQDVLLTFVEQPEHDCFDPFATFCHFVNHCHPNAKKFYGRLVRQGDRYEGGKLEKEFGRPVWYAESGMGRERSNWNLGPTKHRELCKRIAFLAGADDWKKCTGHSRRALCITKCIGSNLTAVDVAAKVRHASLNSQKDYATDCPERKSNRLLVMNNEPVKKRSASASIEEVAAGAVIPQTQPLLPQNRNKLLHIAKKSRVEQEEEKENVATVSGSTLDSKLEDARKENEMLRLALEKQQLQQQLTNSSVLSERSPPPRRHGRSYPPSYHRSPLEDRFCCPHHENACHRRNDGYRRSYPPTNHYRYESPPRHYEDRSQRYHGGYTDEEYDEFETFRRGHHRR